MKKKIGDRKGWKYQKINKNSALEKERRLYQPIRFAANRVSRASRRVEEANGGISGHQRSEPVTSAFSDCV